MICVQNKNCGVPYSKCLCFPNCVQCITVSLSECTGACDHQTLRVEDTTLASRSRQLSFNVSLCYLFMNSCLCRGEFPALAMKKAAPCKGQWEQNISY
jgi:hypothetical protein